MKKEKTERKNNHENSVKKQRIRKNLLRLACVVGMFFMLGYGLSPFIKVGINITNSLDGYVFLIVKNEMPKKNELVAFWPPENELYKDIWFVKYLMGVPGDVVTVKDNRMFYLNDQYIGRAKEKTHSGLDLEMSSPGVIGAGSYFVWTPMEDSFDSRYKKIGLITKDRFIGRAYRIF